MALTPALWYYKQRFQGTFSPLFSINNKRKPAAFPFISAGKLPVLFILQFSSSVKIQRESFPLRDALAQFRFGGDHAVQVFYIMFPIQQQDGDRNAANAAVDDLAVHSIRGLLIHIRLAGINAV